MKTKLFLLLTPILFSCFALLPIAQAAPSPTNVNVVNTPNVNVVNTTASPVQVRDADNPARQPFHAEVRGGFADGASTTGDIPITTVPAGKVLVIEHVSVFGAMLPGQKMVRARVMYRFSVFGHSVVISAQGSNADGSSDYFVANYVSVQLYAYPLTDVTGIAERDGHDLTVNLGSVRYVISGYLVDCPTCAQ